MALSGRPACAVALALTLAGCVPVAVEGLTDPVGEGRGILNGIVDVGHWYVVMVSTDSGGLCSGTLLSARTVVTAGHCYPGLSQVWFDLGSPPQRTAVDVVAETLHPSYGLGESNDLALLKLAADAPVQAVPLLRETLANTPAFIGPRFTFAGYGRSDASGAGYGTRRVVTLPVLAIGPMTLELPAGSPGGAVREVDASEFYHRAEAGKNTCQGDSGGPVFLARGGVERHAGATSYGDSRCAFDGVQARTDSHAMPWIQGVIDAYEADNPCRADGTCAMGCVLAQPPPLGTLRDPDCADRHCGRDGVCVLSCSPEDPDCASLGIDHCGADGICGRGCATRDEDCVLLPGGSPCEGSDQCLTGLCSNGVCCQTECLGACEACSVDAGGSVDGACTLRKGGTVCRAAEGACDAPERCTGGSPHCPADALQPRGALCRPAKAECDRAEGCTGGSRLCPEDEQVEEGGACANGWCHQSVCTASGARLVSESKGAGCSAASTAAGGAQGWLLLVLLVPVLRRRRARKDPRLSAPPDGG